MLSKKECIVLSCLRKDARMSFVKLAGLVGIPVTTVYEVVRRLERKVVDRYTVDVDFEFIGFNVRMNFILRANKKKDLLKFILGSEYVNSVFKIDGNGFFVDALFLNFDKYNSFKEALEGFELIFIREYPVIKGIKLEEAKVF